ncbi:MAG: nucleotidyltransferase family protein [Clostridiales bacterium]|nr:nucleotidyltransferase family protein [Clostridiales bacterium]
MKTAGIIAEYNPFHNGHEYHIAETRRRTGADYVIAAISGDFVQRGAPALLSKYDRARMALQNGADLVFELPVTTALSSAEGFAAGGVSLLSGLGVVDILSCGCESADADPALFTDIASVLADEPETFRKSLSLHLKKGLSFPRARELAVSEYLNGEFFSGIRRSGNTQNEDVSESSHTDVSPGLHRLLSEPNNILALEYAKAIRKSGSPMGICMIPRQGKPYHSEDFSDPCPCDNSSVPVSCDEFPVPGYTDHLSGSIRSSGFPDSCPSAAAIRKFLLSHTENGSVPVKDDAFLLSNIGISADSGNGSNPVKDDASCTDSGISGTDPLYPLRDHVPASVLLSLRHARQNRQFLRENDFSDLLCYALLSNKNNLGNFGSGNTDLTHRAENLLEQFDSWSGFAALLKTKNQTHTAVSRYLAHVLLQIHREDFLLAEDYDRAPYARLLGFHKSAASLLKSIREHSELPVLAQLARDASSLDENRRHLLDLDISSSEIYKRILYTKSGSRLKSEYRQSTICLP